MILNLWLRAVEIRGFCWAISLIGMFVLMVLVACVGDQILDPLLVLRMILFKAGVLTIVPDWNGVDQAIVWNLRLPRIILGGLIGGGLAMAGAALQGLFRNPLADPGLIGVSSGGAVGAVIGIVLFSRWLPDFFQFSGAFLIPVCALVGGIGITLLIYQLSLTQGRMHSATLLLTGIAVNAIANAFIGLMIYLATADELKDFSFWAMGSLAGADWTQVFCALIFIFIPMCLLPRYAAALNLLLLGESAAQFLGINPNRLKRQLIVLTVLMVGSGVALAGIIAFVGLIVPHLIRLVAGSHHRLLLPASASLGAILVVIADLFSRTLIFPSELPIGILTSLVGGPFFIFLLLRERHRLI
jgi:iron complex transport system permease protein